MAPPKPSFFLNTCGSLGETEDPFRFRDFQNELIYADLKHRQILRPWKVNLEDARALGVKCFDQMKKAGLSRLWEVNDVICPKLVKEFYCNLQFAEKGLTAEFYLRGNHGTLTEQSLAKILKCELFEHSIRVFDKLDYRGYDKIKGTLSLTGGKFKNAAYGNMDMEAQILFHALCHIITPKAFKQNSANMREVFYMWCIRNELHLNLPFIILSHMKSFLKGEVKDIPYGMLVSRIARHAMVYFDNLKKLPITGERQAYNARFLRQKLGLLDEEVHEEAEDEPEEMPLIRKRKRSVRDRTGSPSQRITVQIRPGMHSASPSLNNAIANKQMDKGKSIVPYEVGEEEEMWNEEETLPIEDIRIEEVVRLEDEMYHIDEEHQYLVELPADVPKTALETATTMDGTAVEEVGTKEATVEEEREDEATDMREEVQDMITEIEVAFTQMAEPSPEEPVAQSEPTVELSRSIKGKEIMEEEAADEMLEDTEDHPVSIQDIPQSSRGKEVMEASSGPEAEGTEAGRDTEEEEDPVLHGLFILSRQFELINKRMIDGFLRIDNRLSSAQEEIGALRKFVEKNNAASVERSRALEQLVEKKTAELDGCIQALGSRLTDLSSTKEEKPRKKIGGSLSWMEESLKRVETSNTPFPPDIPSSTPDQAS